MGITLTTKYEEVFTHEANLNPLNPVNWVADPNADALEIVSGVCQDNFSKSLFEATEYWNGSLAVSGQFCQCTFANFNDNCTALLSLGYNAQNYTTTTTGYDCELSTDGAGAGSGGVFNNVGSTTPLTLPGFTISSGDVFLFAAINNGNGTANLYVYQNSVLIGFAVDPQTGLGGVFGSISLYDDVAQTDVTVSSVVFGNASLGNGAIGWSPVDSRQAVPGFGPGANAAVVDEQGNNIYSAQDPPFTGNSQVSDNSRIPPTDSRANKPVDSRVSVPTNSRVAPPFGEAGEP